MILEKLHIRLAVTMVLLCTVAESCVVAEYDYMKRKSLYDNKIRFNMSMDVKSTGGVSDAIWQLSPTVLLMSESQKNVFNTNFSSVSPTSFIFRVDVFDDLNKYSSDLYDTGKEYLNPTEEDEKYLYARGYSPTRLLQNTNGDYRRLDVVWQNTSEKELYEGKIDFLSLDANDNFRGSLNDKFGVGSNVLVFRHLTSKILFLAYRDSTMIDNQFIRDLKIKNIKILYSQDNSLPDLFSEWQGLYYPSQLTWNENAGSDGNGNSLWGYSCTELQPISDSFYASLHSQTPLVIDRAMRIDSIFVSNNRLNGVDKTAAGGIYLKMDVEATVSHINNFPGDGESNNGLTYRREWRDIIIKLKTISNGVENDLPVTRLEQGNQYNVYLKFVKNGVYIDGYEVNWNNGGMHDMIITPLS